MRSKDLIFKNLNSKKPTKRPIVATKDTRYENRVETFLQNLKKSGANGYEIKHSLIEDKIQKLYPDAKNIASIYEFGIRSINPNTINTPHELKDIDLAIIKAEFGVAENGAVYINEKNNIHQAIYTISKNLIILLDKKSILDNMHQAYEKISSFRQINTLFISGPSKTADIEQTLVIGAHGAKSVCVLLISDNESLKLIYN